MKKIFTVLAAALMISLSASAQHEIGGIVGGLMGASYKYWFTDNLALQADLAVGLTQAAYEHYSCGQYDFTINPNALYHFDLIDNLKLYTGGGISFGLMDGLASGTAMSYAPRYITIPGYGEFDVPNYHHGGSTVSGKFGINAVVGLAYKFDAVPVVLAFDFRPGYGLSFNDSKYTAHFFDWKLAFAVRYAF